MRIDPNQYLGNVQSENVQQTTNTNRGSQLSDSEGTKDTAGVDSDDQFQPSQTLDQVQRLQAQLSQIPDVRSDRVAALSQKIQNGTYNPSNDQLAGAIISDMGANKRS
jgi:negative regulator of flagellin synthesis FlgM